ncbi:MAG: hypothetical protein LBS85_04385 [Clostridiales Family XIII bacterium]|jgi:hypothetical protein|nr:hypothetical protein [Clostridiales Family XIII bacterium]
MKNTRAVFLAVLLVLTSWAAAACGENPLPAGEDYDFSIFIGDAADPIFVNHVVERYEAETGLNIEPVYLTGGDGERDLERMLDSADPVAAFIVSGGEGFEKALENGYVENLSVPAGTDGALADRLIDHNRLLWSVDGYGLAADTRLLCGLFGLDDAGALIASLRGAAYSEWSDFASKLDAYISSGAAEPVVFGEQSYPFAPVRTALTATLTGVFALPGGDGAMGARFMDAVLREEDADAWEELRGLPENEAYLAARPFLAAYAAGLEDWTSHLAGAFAAGIRGESFVNTRYYSAKKAEEIFMDGKAVFAFLDVGSYKSLAQIDAEKAESLVFLPVKMPTPGAEPDKTEGDGSFVPPQTEGDGSFVPPEESGTEGEAAEGEMPPEVVDDTIVCAPARFVCVNTAAEKEVQKQALDFILQLTAAAAAEQDALQRSAEEYFLNGRARPDNTGAGAYERWYDAAFLSGGLRSWLSDANWTTEEREALILRLFRSWYGDA